MIDIKFNSSDKRASRLSNFTRREFVFEGVLCNSLEGVLQSLKTYDPVKQRQICALEGKEAKDAGSYIYRDEINAVFWQELYWRGRPFFRNGKEYAALIRMIFDAAYQGDSTFRDDLLATEHEELQHSIGEDDPRKTILTETEFLHQLYRLRARAYRELPQQLALPGIRDLVC